MSNLEEAGKVSRQRCISARPSSPPCITVRRLFLSNSRRDTRTKWMRGAMQCRANFADLPESRNSSRSYCCKVHVARKMSLGIEHANDGHHLNAPLLPLPVKISDCGKDTISIDLASTDAIQILLFLSLCLLEQSTSPGCEFQGFCGRSQNGLQILARRLAFAASSVPRHHRAPAMGHR